MLDELRRLHDTGLAIRYRDLELCGREDLVGAIRVEIGSIVRARRLARIPDPPRAWSEQEAWDEDRVIGEILELARDHQPLAYSKAPSKLRSAALRYFDSWDAALEAAGLDPDDHRLRRKPYDDEAMLARIRELAREYPEMTLGQLHDHPDGLAIWRRFDSIEDAARQAGVEGWPIRKNRDAYSVDETVQALKARNRARKPLSKTMISTDDSRLNLGIQRHFRTMEAALTEAGLESKLPDTVRWSREEVLRQLEERRDAGKPLNASAVPATLHAAAIKFFGSYMAAAKRFGAKPLKVNWTRETVLAELRRLAKKHKPLSTQRRPERRAPRVQAVLRDVGAGLRGGGYRSTRSRSPRPLDARADHRRTARARARRSACFWQGARQGVTRGVLAPVRRARRRASCGWRGTLTWSEWRHDISLKKHSSRTLTALGSIFSRLGPLTVALMK